MEEYTHLNVFRICNRAVRETDMPCSIKQKLWTYGSCFVQNHLLDPTDDACCMRHFDAFTFKPVVGGDGELESVQNTMRYWSA